MINLNFSTNLTFFKKEVEIDFSSVGDSLTGNFQIMDNAVGIDIGQAINKILGSTLFTKGDLVLNGANTNIDFYTNHQVKSTENANDQTPSAVQGMAIAAKLNFLDFQYGFGKAAQVPHKTTSSFFFQLDLSKLVSYIPNVNVSEVGGFLFMGFSGGNTVYFDAIKSKDGTVQQLIPHTTKKGFYFGGKLVADHKTINLSQLSGNDGTTVSLNSKSKLSTAKKGIKWINLKGKKIGPLTLHSLGYQLKDKQASLLIKADLSLGPLSLSMLGMGLKVNIKTLLSKNWDDAFSFLFYGLGLSFTKGDLSIAGFFEKNPSQDAYIGGILVKTKAFAITGVGAYGHVNGHKSLFGFLFLEKSLGGPPSFQVEGLALTFGYNRKIILPSVSQVDKFPLVSYALSGEAPDLKGGSKNPLTIFSEKMGQYIPPKEHNYFFGIGVKFQTYKLVNSFALLTISAGEDLVIALTGLSKLALPPGLNSPRVYVEIELAAMYNVEEGVLEINAQVAPGSYVLSQNAHLTGGFAFYAWFKGNGDGVSTPIAGDFVITLGGYHPDFIKPSYYPAVPRLGLNWQVCSELSITGSLYAALTARAIMAGGAMHIVWKSGSLEADCKLGANFLISWKPFHYDAAIYVSLKAGLHVDIFGVHKFVSLDIGANLHIWGPSFSGHAHLHVSICDIGFSYSIDFGTPNSPPPKLNWQAFESSFLPAPKKVLSLSVAKGLIKVVKKNWLINPKDLRIRIESIIPFTTYNTKTTSTNDYAIPVTKFKQVTSNLTVSIKRGTSFCTKHFTIEHYTKAVACAIWEDTRNKDLGGINGKRTNPLPVGLLLSPAGQVKEHGTKPLPVKNFAFEPYPHSLDSKEKESTILNPSFYPPGKFAPLTLKTWKKAELFNKINKVAK